MWLRLFWQSLRSDFNMTVNYLVNLLKDCEYLEGFKIGTGFLSDKENSVSVLPDGNDEVIRSYCDGAKIRGFGFSLIFRLKSNMGDNLKNYTLLKEISDWILSQTFDNKSNAIKISVIKGAKLLEDNIHSLKYEIKCRFEYLEEKEI